MSLTDDSNLVVTSPDSWTSPRKQGFLLRLPSGNVCRVRRTLDLSYLIQSGKIPNPLRNTLAKMMDEEGTMLNFADLGPSERIQAVQMVRETVCRSVTEPKVHLVPEGENPETWIAPEGGLSIFDLSDEDQFFIYSVAQGGATDLESFREQQARAMELVRAREGVRSAPVKPAPAKRSRSGGKRN